MIDLRVKHDNMMLSYIHLRRLIGVLGMSLPIVCFLGGELWGGVGLQTTISGYYYTDMRDVFVGILIGVSMFLMTYKGYELLDQLITSLTGLTGLGVAIFPCNMINGGDVPVGVFNIISKNSNIVHISNALLFFTLLAINSIFIFTMTDQKVISSNKIKRNRIYRVCGWTIIACIICLILAVILMPSDKMSTSYIVIALETIMLEAFGISWLVKGKTILRD